MIQQKTTLPGMEATLTAHRDENISLMMVSIRANEVSETPPKLPLRIALVIDRSGSMSGEKLEITKSAVAQFVRSLDAADRVAIVTYDGTVDLICALEAPNEALARRVETIQPGGSTDLYGGWVMGAKIVGIWGRVILLSDGQANHGKFTDAASLAQHALVSYQRYGVTTTTIGVGTDYDEGLMAGMAQTGGGAHYFAHTARAITDAFSQERYSAGSVVLQQVSVRCDGITEQIGHFWSGEVKKRVFVVKELKDLAISVRYTEKETGASHTDSLLMPTEFGYSEEVKLEYLLQKASDAEAEMLRVRSPRSAAEMRDRLRGIVLEMLAHPSSDESSVALVIDRLRASMLRLDELEKNYVEANATMHRKRSMQSSFNLKERAKSFSSFDDDAAFVASTSGMSAPVDALRMSPEALKLAPLEKWVEWQALPIDVSGGVIVVALEDPRRGFVISQIEKQTGLKVKSVFAGVSAEEIVRLLQK